ncbi:MAG: type I glyceraldehyde-3-phosphate dehydrogenase [Saprospirales bacterium]|nr:MAG: type I glyceraldehyde-3-phosphate dehydrogenase [Saprospirales bacterium]
MTKIKVAINGFGRIGRISLREILKSDTLECVAINDLTDNTTLAHLFKYDSAHGRLPYSVTAEGDEMVIDGKHRLKCYSEKDPANLPWKKLGVDVVLESTGVFRTKEAMSKHLQAGAKKVVLSAPAKGDGVPTVVLGVNHHILKAEDNIISNASCTTNCLAPLAMVLDENFGIEQGVMNTIHAYTADQRLMDAPHSDLRRARAAAVSIIPTSTGAASAAAIVLPQLKGKLTGAAMRVPTISGSATDFVFMLKKDPSVEEINAAVKKAAENELKGIIEYTEDPIVSVDIISNTHSSIFDALSTMKIGKLYKTLAWYDNEYAYSCRTVELMEYLVKLK